MPEANNTPVRKCQHPACRADRRIAQASQPPGAGSQLTAIHDGLPYVLIMGTVVTYTVTYKQGIA